VTTVACALGAVWPTEKRVVLAEFDPSGGDLAARFGLSAKRGMTSLALDARSLEVDDSFRLTDHLQTLTGGLEVLVGPAGSRAARRIDASLPRCLDLVSHKSLSDESDVDRSFHDANRRESWVESDLLIDCGRIVPGAVGQVAALAAADVVVIVARPSVDSVASTRWIAESLNRSRQERVSDSGPDAIAGLVLVGKGPISDKSAASVLDLPLLANIPDDRVGAAAMRGETVRSTRLARSDLVASARRLAGVIVKLTATEDRDPGFEAKLEGPLSILEAREASI
jgi:MinD-like ATPase involved in chromosome partitioning or flagellar assembly